MGKYGCPLHPTRKNGKVIEVGGEFVVAKRAGWYWYVLVRKINGGNNNAPSYCKLVDMPLSMFSTQSLTRFATKFSISMNKACSRSDDFGIGEFCKQ